MRCGVGEGVKGNCRVKQGVTNYESLSGVNEVRCK